MRYRTRVRAVCGRGEKKMQLLLQGGYRVAETRCAKEECCFQTFFFQPNARSLEDFYYEGAD